jgi:hypothetical protein
MEYNTGHRELILQATVTFKCFVNLPLVELHSYIIFHVEAFCPKDKIICIVQQSFGMSDKRHVRVKQIQAK